MYSQESVRDRIHNLRGEQFRHLQNVRGSRSHITSTHHTLPSLPFRLLRLDDEIPSDSSPPTKLSSLSQTRDDLSNGTSRPPAGPSPPKSWRTKTKKDILDTKEWRAGALSLIFNHLPSSSSSSNAASTFTTLTAPSVPSLTLLCLQILLKSCSASEFNEFVIPYIPLHLRKALVRFTAVDCPLSNTRLYPLLEEHGHVDGEILIVGPAASLKDDHFPLHDIRNSPGNNIFQPDVTKTESELNAGSLSWDDEDDTTEPSQPLTTFILLSTPILMSTLFSLPPTVTHLALINVSSPISLHRLPTILPLLQVLDVSYNTWLGFLPERLSGGGSDAPVQAHVEEHNEPARLINSSVKALVGLDKVNWKLWRHLRVLGFRGNYVSKGLVEDINEGRWDDLVDVVM